MMKLQDLFDSLQKKGIRLTRARKSILKILFSNSSPLSAEDFIKALKKEKIEINKSTVYREIEFLKSQNLIEEMQFEERKRFFEGNFKEHHHHLYCLKCKKIEDIEIHSDLAPMEKEIERNKNFKIEKHSLDFFGACADCK